jgi:hypothetical protein
MSEATNPMTEERLQELFGLLLKKRKYDLRPRSIIDTLTYQGISQNEAEEFEKSLLTNPTKYCPSPMSIISSLHGKSNITAVKECFAYLCTGAYPDHQFIFQNGRYALRWPRNNWSFWVEWEEIQDIETFPSFAF